MLYCNIIVTHYSVNCNRETAKKAKEIVTQGVKWYHQFLVFRETERTSIPIIIVRVIAK